MYVIVFLFIALSGCYGLTYCLLLLCLWRRMSMDRVSLSLRLKKKEDFLDTSESPDDPVFFCTGI
jgi:hypothetical protein